MTRRERPVLLYDGDCGFCSACVRLARRHLRTSRTPPEFLAFQFADLEALGTSAERAAYEVVWVGCDGRIRGGAQAVAALLLNAGGAWWPLGAVLRIPPFRWAAHGVYRLVAAHRHSLPGGTAACAPARPAP